MKNALTLLSAACGLLALSVTGAAAARSASPSAPSVHRHPPSLQMAAQSNDPPAIPPEKANAYVGCLNRLSGRAYDARARYLSWLGSPAGPTGKEPIVYGTYEIYDTSKCRADVKAAAPHDAELEAAADAYVDAVTKLEPLLKEANDYYTQQNYKDDKMAKGKALHPRLVAAWDAFALADKKLRDSVEAINERRANVKLAEIERSEGRSQRYYVEALMIQAKRVMRAETATTPDLATTETALNEFEGMVQSVEKPPASGSGNKIGSIFIGSAKSFLVTAKQAMRRTRDKVPYTAGEQSMLNAAGAGWMVEGSPQRVLRDYNSLIDSYNRGPGI